MSAFPNVLFGPDNEIYNTYTDRRYPLGTKLLTRDGRIFRFAKAGASALVAGNVLQARVPLTNHVLQTPSAAAVGATSVTVALGATAVAANDYQGGHLAVLASNSGEFYSYPIMTHPAVLSSGSFVVPLERGITVQVAIGTTANSVSLFSNPWFGVIQAPITTRTMPVVGVALKPVAASSYGWLQTRGPANVLAIGTLVVGDPVISPTGTAAGGVGPQNSTLAVKETQIGWTMAIGTTTHGSQIFLTID